LPVINELRTAEQADLDTPLLDEGQRHNVLITANKPLCAIDRIERPESFTRCPPTSIDRVKDLTRTQLQSVVQRVQHRLKERPPRRRPQHAGILLSDKGIIGECPGEPIRDERLHREIGHCDW
jgi:hypothetical protein